MVVAHQRPGEEPPPTPGADVPTRADALRRIAAEVSGHQDLDRPVPGRHRRGVRAVRRPAGRPVAVRRQPDAAPPGRPARAVAGDPRDHRDPAAGRPHARAWTRSAQREVRILTGDFGRTLPKIRTIYRRAGVRSICYVPIVFRDVPLGLLVLYHVTDHAWTADETDLARAFADQMATAIDNARLAASTRTMTGRLRAISELAGRLSRLQDLQGIALAIVAEARRLIDHDTIRVYRVDHEAGMCEPIAFQGTFLGQSDPDPAMLRVAIGQGLTGWVAAHGEAIRISDAAADPRSVIVQSTDGPESMLVVPMTFDGVVHGVIVVSKEGRDRFDADDETTLAIFAGYAAQAFVNGTSMERLRQQQAELEHQLEGQRRLLEVNERLLSTLEPAGVLDLIADSLKAIVPYDSLTVYQVDRAAGVRRAVVARDRFADLILANESPLGSGHHRLGRRSRRGGAVQRGAPRPAVDPGARDPVRARVDDRRPAVRQRRHHRHPQHRPDGRGGGRLQRQRVRADPAVRRPGLDRPPERRDARRGPGPGRPRRPDRPAQPRLVPARAGRRDRRRRGRPAVRGPDVRPRRVQGVQRRLWPPGRRRVPGRGRRGDRERDARRRPAVPLRRRRVRGGPPGRRPAGRPRGRRPDPARRGGPLGGDR